jgi:hypothetical protein
MYSSSRWPVFQEGHRYQSTPSTKETTYMFSRVLTFARHHTIAVAALFIALGGTSYAAGRTVLAGNSAGGSTILACQAPSHVKGAGVLVIVTSFAQCPNGYLHFSWSTTGPAGNTGPQGNAGQTGSQGQIGSNGSNGAAGLQGFTGLAGATGDIGAAGSNGSNGATGNAGSTGATGAAGSNGTDGIQGPQGPKGDTGNAGSDGSDGATGATGATGDTGAAGPTASAFASVDGVYTLIGGSDTTELTTTIDPSFSGNVLLNASVEVFFQYTPGPSSQVTCNAYVDSNMVGTIEDSAQGDVFTTIPLTGGASVSAGSHTVSIACYTSDPDTYFVTGNLTVVAASS